MIIFTVKLSIVFSLLLVLTYNFTHGMFNNISKLIEQYLGISNHDTRTITKAIDGTAKNSVQEF